MELCGFKRAQRATTIVSVLSPSPTVPRDTTFLWLSTTFHATSTQENEQVPTSQLLMARPGQTCTLLRDSAGTMMEESAVFWLWPAWASLYKLSWKVHSLPTLQGMLPFLCRVLPPHDQILICSSLINSIGLTLMTSWDPAPSQMSAGPRQLVAGLGIPWDFCWAASGRALAKTLNFYQPGEHQLLLPGDSLRTYLMQIAYHQRLFQWLSPTGSGQVEVDLRVS